MLSCIEASPQPVFCPLFLGGAMKEDAFYSAAAQSARPVLEKREWSGLGRRNTWQRTGGTNTKTKRGQMQKIGEKNTEIRDGGGR